MRLPQPALNLIGCRRVSSQWRSVLFKFKKPYALPCRAWK